MAHTVVFILSLLAVVNCNDLRNGFTNIRERLIHDKKYDLNPSIYTRSETVIVNVNSNERISRIEVIDLRDEKDGVATITSGGVGDRTVTIQLSGPAVFRGMTFIVRVYAVFDDVTYDQRSSQINGYPSNPAYPTKTGGYNYDTQQQYSGDLRHVKQ